MAAIQLAKFRTTIRFVQGYRYLDRCGDALVRLENILDEHWIVNEVSASRGIMRNHKLGMGLGFSSDSLQTEQTEFISFEHFRDQTCKIYELLWKQFEIERILSPGVGIYFHIPFDEISEAERCIRNIRAADFDHGLVNVMGGEKTATRHVLCTEERVSVNQTEVSQRRRVELSAIKQYKGDDFDTRLMQRLPLIPLKNQEAMKALMQARRMHPRSLRTAVEIELENSLERELSTRTFKLAGLLDDTLEWAESIKGWFGARLENIR